MPAPPRPKPWFLVVRALIGLGALATVMGFAGTWGWSFELASHFRPQYALGLAVCAGLAALARRFGAAAVAAAAALVNLALLSPSWFGAPEATPGPQRLKLLIANVQLGNPDPARLVALVEAERPDVVGLLELGPDWADALDRPLAGLPHRRVLPRDDRFGIAVYSRRPIEVTPHEGDHTPVLWARVPLGDQAVNLAVVHVYPPMTPQLAGWRDEQLLAIAREAAARPEPTVVCGDLNATPWSPIFDRVLEVGGLADTRRGFGVQASWPSPLGPLGIPIDHCLTTAGLVAVDRRIGPALGSDHRPVIVTLARAAASP